MHKTLGVLVLLLCTVCLLAQDNMGNSSGAATSTIQGCLSKSGSYFYLTDSSGTKYHLVGYKGNELIKHVGHTVEITGAPTTKTYGTTQQGNASTAKEAPVFKVNSLKHIADTCKTM
jgi:hypothetical protein